MNLLPGVSPVELLSRAPFPVAAATEPAAVLALADALLLLCLLVLGLGVLQLARIARALEATRSGPPAPGPEPVGVAGSPTRAPASAEPSPELLAAVVAAVQVAGEPAPPSAARPDPR